MDILRGMLAFDSGWEFLHIWNTLNKPRNDVCLSINLPAKEGYFITELSHEGIRIRFGFVRNRARIFRSRAEILLRTAFRTGFRSWHPRIEATTPALSPQGAGLDAFPCGVIGNAETKGSLGQRKQFIRIRSVWFLVHIRKRAGMIRILQVTFRIPSGKMLSCATVT